MARYIKPLPPVEYLHQCFEYTEDGKLIGKVRPREHFATQRGFSVSSARTAGVEVGGLTDKGYVSFELTYLGKSVTFLAHRIIWAMHNGPIPEGYWVDHKDLNRSNNRIGNLRLALPTNNSHNQNEHSNNTSGAKCVFWCKKSKVWFVKILTNGKIHGIGRFKEYEAAVNAAKSARENLHKEFANHGN